MEWSFVRQLHRVGRWMRFCRQVFEPSIFKVFCGSVAVLASTICPVAAIEPLSKRLLDQGYRHLCAANYPVAIQSLTAALEKEPKNPAAMRYLGYAFVRSGQAPQAAEPFESLIKTGKSCPEDRAGLGDALYYSGQTADALKCYELALKMSPGLEVAYDGMIRCRISLGRLDEAADTCRKAAQGARTLSAKTYFLTKLNEIQSQGVEPSADDRDDAACAPG